MTNENSKMADQAVDLNTKGRTQKYYVRWRHIPPYAMMTPLMYISVDHTQVMAKENASDYDIKIAISKEFNWIDVDSISIESYQTV